MTVDARKRAWARLLAKVYEIDPMVCPKCGAEMTVISIIENLAELGRAVPRDNRFLNSPDLPDSHVCAVEYPVSTPPANCEPRLSR